MITKQRLARKLRHLEIEIGRLREEIEGNESNKPGITLRGKYPCLKGITYKDIIEAKGIWRPAVPK